MGSIDKFYRLFEKESLNKALDTAFNSKADITWIALLMSILSTSLVLYKNIYEIQKLTTAKAHVPLDLLAGTIFVGILVLISIVWFIISIKKWVRNHKYSFEDLKKEIFQSEVRHEHNHVFIIKKNFDNTPKILFLKKNQWGYMLPYKKSEKLLSPEEIEAVFANYFPGTKASVIILENSALNDVIKKKPEEGYMKFSYIFCHVKIHSSFVSFEQLIRTSASLKEYSFMSLGELKDDLLTMKSNSDIVNHLTEENLFESKESFTSQPEIALPKGLKVIWNITDQCSFDCAFCATKRNTAKSAELSFENRINVAEQLRKIEGIKIDFAGGDPLYDSAAKYAIKHISSYMIKEDITITSTGIGLSFTEDEILQVLPKKYDISYDYPSTWESEHRSKEYNEKNFDQIKRIKNCGFFINILSTLSNYNIDKNIIKAMISELKSIDPNQITLLRLMPVGKQEYQNYPNSDSYDPSEAIRMFKDGFGEKVKLHCAFRAYLPGNSNEDFKCTLLQKKIGIDNIGNVYACAWAGYLRIPDKNNPFFLGNILEGGIEKIFKSKGYDKLYSEIENSDHKFCKIFSFLENNTEGVTRNHDKFIDSYKLTQ